MSLTVGLTYRCNSRCKTCNIWKMKSGNELNLQEIEKVFSEFGKNLIYLTLSGGEPFLRNDIVKICQIAYFHCRPLAITIPTNCLLGDQTVRDIKNIVKSCPDTQFILNLSLDGWEDLDDEIRGIHGHFRKVISVFKKLNQINEKNLQIGVHTVISRYNVKLFSIFADKIISLKPSSYITEIAEERKELGTIGSNISPGKIDYIAAINWLLCQIKTEKPGGFAKVTQIFRKHYYLLVKNILLENKMIIPCYAGYASGQIAPDGDVWNCCVKANIFGNLIKEKYFFRRIWFSGKADEYRKMMKRQKCFCPMANASYTNMLVNPKIMLKVVLGLWS